MPQENQKGAASFFYQVMYAPGIPHTEDHYDKMKINTKVTDNPPSTQDVLKNKTKQTNK